MWQPTCGRTVARNPKPDICLVLLVISQNILLVFVKFNCQAIKVASIPACLAERCAAPPTACGRSSCDLVSAETWGSLPQNPSIRTSFSLSHWRRKMSKPQELNILSDPTPWVPASDGGLLTSCKIEHWQVLSMLCQMPICPPLWLHSNLISLLWKNPLLCRRQKL